MASRAKSWVGTDNIITGDEQRKLQATLDIMREVYLQGPFDKTPIIGGTELAEQDSRVLDWMLEQFGWERFGLGYEGDTRRQREWAINDSRRLWRYSVVAQWQVNLWTNYGLGENVIITPIDKSKESGEKDEQDNPIPLAEYVFKEFWTSDRNQSLLAADKLHDRSNWTLVDGERFWAYFASDLDGESLMRELPPEEITEIIKDPNDSMTPWFYKREFTDAKNVAHTLYYPDWQVFFDESLDEKAETAEIEDEQRADLQNGAEVAVGAQAEAGTVVCVQHVAHNRKDSSSLRGWPLLAPAGAPWIRSHRDFMQDRAAVTKSAAMFTYKFKHTGGSRSGLGLRSQLQTALTATNYTETNPPPVAGTPWVGNEAVDMEKLHNIGTAAGDAKTDHENMLLMAGLAGGIYPHWLGAGDAYRLATATSMEGPMLRQFSRYQLFWSSQFRVMVRIVLQFHERYNSVEFETYEAEVSTDRLVEADLAMVTTSIGQFYRDVLVPQAELLTLDVDALKSITAAVTRLFLQALGVADPDELASDEAFEVGVEPEPEEEPPVPPEEEVPPTPAEVVEANLRAGAIGLSEAVEWALGEMEEDNGSTVGCS